MTAFREWKYLQQCSKDQLKNWLANSLPALDVEQPSLYSLPSGALRPAAVLIPLIIDHNNIQIVLTKRALTLPSHKGQICFPGGGFDNKDRSLQHTALREWEEETGILSSSVTLVSQLAPIQTVSNFIVHPFVGIVERPAGFKISEGEVEVIFELPLPYLLNRDHLQFLDFKRKGITYRLPYLTYGPYHIWGVTAMILKEFRDYLLASPLSKASILEKND